MHRSQIFFYILSSFIIGVFAGSFFSISKNAVLISAVICTALIAVFYRRDSRWLNPKLAFAAFLMLFFLAGVLRYNTVHSKTHNLQKFAEAQEKVIDPQNKHPIEVALYGYVAGYPEITGDKQRFVFYSKQLEAIPYVIKTNEKVLVATQLHPKYKYGDKLKIIGNIKNPENYDDFDYQAYLAKDRIYTTLFYPEITILPSDKETQFLDMSDKLEIIVLGKIFRIKSVFEESISRSIAEPNASFINGILLGDRSQLPQDVKDNFSRTGTSHILAISGYNITLIAGIISWFFLLFFRRPKAFWFSLLGVAIFTILTGAQASVIRAAIMGSLVLLAYREGRLSDPRNAIVLAGGVMIALNPEILRYDIGFQLSFLATLGLIYVAPIIERFFIKFPKIFGFRDVVTATISAQFFVLPLLLYYFNNLSLTSLPANVLVLPTIPFAMLLGFFGGFAGAFIPFLGQLIGYLTWILTSVELGIIKLFAMPSWALVSLKLPWYLVILSYVLIVLALKKLSTPKKEGEVI